MLYIHTIHFTHTPLICDEWFTRKCKRNMYLYLHISLCLQHISPEMVQNQAADLLKKLGSKEHAIKPTQSVDNTVYSSKYTKGVESCSVSKKKELNITCQDTCNVSPTTTNCNSFLNCPMYFTSTRTCMIYLQ